MRITTVTPILVGPRPSADGWSRGLTAVLVRLETDTGLVGWGEAFALTHRERATAEIILALGRAVIARPEISPRAFLHHVAQPMETKRPSLDFAAAVSAIEIALWDLAGQAAGLPLHALLGGALTDRLPVYANAWDDPVQAPRAIADRCARMRAEGYRAVKIYPLRQPDLARAEEVVRLTRAAIGPEADLLLDFAIEADPVRAVEAARRFAPYDPYWIEEPVTGDDPDTLAEFRAQTGMRVTTGERQAGLHHFRTLLDRRAADVLNPDIAGAGGILRMLEIGAMAQAHSVRISPHSWNSTTVAFLAMLHVSAVMPNADYCELYYDYLELGRSFARCDYVLGDGHASLPNRPGLGIEMDEAALAALGSVYTG